MDWEELEDYLREQIKAQPRGFQTALAERLQVTPASVAGYTSRGKSIPVKHVSVILDALGLELAVRPREPVKEK
ncbi:hypothetical protein [Deinococcus murrayi]|uniref:hypothetical protein n=1 Tax=Deinococcus murrayi TaxID=68910 RepID=UPI0012F88744|nr:hypothetical protein [Deinococcus murrayi]